MLARVGKPDDVSTRKDWEMMSAHTHQVWRSVGVRAYGCGHLGTNRHRRESQGRVVRVTGQGATPPDGMFTQPELRALLEASTTRPAAKRIPL